MLSSVRRRHTSHLTETPSPSPDQPFLGWSGACSGTATTCTITIKGDASATATFGYCAASYPTVRIPPPPPDLDCGEISFTNFTVLHNVPNPDPHGFDGDHDGVGCET